MIIILFGNIQPKSPKPHSRITLVEETLKNTLSKEEMLLRANQANGLERWFLIQINNTK